MIRKGRPKKNWLLGLGPQMPKRPMHGPTMNPMVNSKVRGTRRTQPYRQGPRPPGRTLDAMRKGGPLMGLKTQRDVQNGLRAQMRRRRARSHRR